MRFRQSIARGLQALPREWPLWVVVAVLAVSTIGTVLGRTHGAPSVPLDDAYIHFQFARGFANFTPFVYTKAGAPVAGATSLLWPALLAPAFWLGIDADQIIWVAWLLGFISLGLVAHETLAMARKLLSPQVALGTTLMVLCFGGLTWLAASGMEALPFAWLWLRTFRRLADWYEQPGTVEPLHRSRLGRELLLLCIAAPAMRPEGLVGSCFAGLLFAFRLRGFARGYALVAIALGFVPRVVVWAATESWANTTAHAKWMLYNPYLDAGDIATQVSYNLTLLFGTLFNGELWSATVIPRGGAILAVCSLPALCLQSYLSRHFVRGTAVLLAAFGMFIPATYDTFLWNRLRYLWPFAPAWCIALGALCDLLGDTIKRFSPNESRALFAGVIAGCFAAKLPDAIDDVAESAWAIREQQAWLGRWANAHLPKTARIGLNDTGAIAYFSERQTFDIVGLTTPGEAEYWVAGAGSRFEHYERLPREVLPTHFIVYPEWFGIDPLLGELLVERTVNASILGGATMVAARADFVTLGSAERPIFVDVHKRMLVDRLDVADLTSERDHAYELFRAHQSDNRVWSRGDLTDGGRAGRTHDRFRLQLVPGGLLVARLGADAAATIEATIDARPLSNQTVTSTWQEYAWQIPEHVPKKQYVVQLHGPIPWASLQYWSYGATH